MTSHKEKGKKNKTTKIKKDIILKTVEDNEEKNIENSTNLIQKIKNKKLKKFKLFLKKDLKKKDKYYKRQRALRLLLLVAYNFKRGNSIAASASLSFYLLLALIPIIFLGFSLLDNFGAFEGGSALIIEYIQNNYFPIKSDNFDGVLNYLNGQNYSTMGTVGVITLLIFSVNLFNRVEKNFNAIWRVTNHRKFVKRFTSFFTFLMLSPIFFSMSLHFSSRVQTMIKDSNFSALTAIFNYTVSGFFLFAMFLVIFLFLPNTNVKIRSAIIGAIVSATIFALLKLVFQIYINTLVLNNYKNIFGTMSLVPIFLIWIYLSWIVTLIGVTVSYVYQNQDFLWQYSKNIILDSETEKIEVLNTEKLIEIFYIIVSNFKEGKGGVELHKISQYFKINPDILDSLITKWIENDLLIRYETPSSATSYIPKRPLNSIKIDDIISPFINDISLTYTSENFKTFILNYRNTRKQYIKVKSVDDLI